LLFAPKSPIERSNQGRQNGPCWRHGATTVVEWDAPKIGSLCTKAHSYAGVQENIGLRPITPVAILCGR